MDESSIETVKNIDNNNDAHNVKIDIGNNKPHNGKLITKLEVSSNEEHLVTYSQENDSIVGWSVEDKDEGPLKLDKTIPKIIQISSKR
ncbi:hypothetical protein RclHR1_08950005 [Rhizophagus clarus]|uniref:Uncharacterized protein n=1 Tax=Rhizophagus clarus TaxID=94130 RepID=A0A2Z6SP86_9GLOM|nr:hypothetical protein RclHR1_08950005 [Rhizophagus clarus]GET03466.1 hypothetical protein GLOIN_2v1794049 [Rhizophagus clarus]